jgi:hypothetical protein
MKKLILFLLILSSFTFAQTEIPCGTDTMIYKHTDESASSDFNIINSQLFALRDTIWWAANSRVHWLPADTSIVSHTVGKSYSQAQSSNPQWRFDFLYDNNLNGLGRVNMYFMYRGNIFNVSANSIYGLYKIQKFNTVTKLFTTTITDDGTDFGGANFIKYPYLAPDSSFNTINFLRAYNGQTDYKWMWYKPLDDSSSTTSVGNLGITDVLPDYLYYYPIAFFGVNNAEYLFLAVIKSYNASPQSFAYGYPVKMVKHTGTIKNVGWETAINLDSVKATPVIAINSTRTKAYILFTSLSKKNTYCGLHEFDGTTFTKIPLPPSLISDTLIRVNSFSLISDDELFVNFTAGDTVKTTNRIYRISSKVWSHCSTAKFHVLGYLHTGTSIGKSDIHSAVLNKGLLFVASKYQSSAEYGFGRIDIQANAYVNTYANAHYGVFWAKGYSRSGTLEFTSPADQSTFLVGSTVNISWEASRDSVTLVLPDTTIMIFGTSSYQWIVPSITGMISVTDIQGYLTNETGVTDNIHDVRIFSSRSLIIDTVITSGNHIQIYTESVGVDSLNYYINGTLIGNSVVNKTVIPNLTTGEFDVQQYFKDPQVMVKEKRDTTSIVKQVNYSGMGRMFDGRICYKKTSFNPFFTQYVLEQGCGWVAGLLGLSGKMEVLYDTSGTYYWRNFNDGIPVMRPFGESCPCDIEGLYLPPYYIIDRNELAYKGYTAVKTGINPAFGYPERTINQGSYITPIGSNTLVENNYRYKFVGRKLYVDDILNGQNDILYCDLTPLYSSITIWIAPAFQGSSVLLGAYRLPFETIYQTAVSLHPNYETSYQLWWMCLVKAGGEVECRPAFIPHSIPGITTAEIDTISSPVNFVPRLIIVDNSGFNSMATVPLLTEHKVLLPLLYDIWTSTAHPTVPLRIVIKTNSFRGIHPKIWKYGRLDGVKPE